MDRQASDQTFTPFLLLAIVLVPSSLALAWIAEQRLGLSSSSAAFAGILWLTLFYAKLRPAKEPDKPSPPGF